MWSVASSFTVGGVTDLRPVAMSELAALVGPGRPDEVESCPVCGAWGGVCGDGPVDEPVGGVRQQVSVVEHQNSLLRAEADRDLLGWRSTFRKRPSQRAAEFGFEDVAGGVAVVDGVAVRTVRCDVYEEVWPPGASTPLFMLRLRAGDSVPELEVVRMVGGIPEGG